MKAFIILLIGTVAVHAAPSEVKLKDTNLKIIGGQDAKKGDAPWIASLQECFLSIICYHVCGAAILNERWVVTAAHCLGEDVLFTYRIVTGMLNLNENDPDKQFEDINLRVIHPLYNTSIEEIQTNDIALLRLSRPLRFNKVVAPVRLPPQGLEPTTGNGIMAGWGSINPDTDNPVTPNNLQIVTLPVMSITECSDAIYTLLPNSSLPLDMDGGNFCAGPMTGGISPCVGDNGGPLVIDNVLAGIASWGFSPCALTGAPTVFTNMGSYVNWVSQFVVV